jgi:hypothetical protein
VKVKLLLAASTFAFASLSAPATAQMNMPGMTMPKAAKPAAKKAPATKKRPRPKAAPKHSSRSTAGHASHQPPGHAGPSTTGMSMPMPGPGGAARAMPMDHSPARSGQMAGMSMQSANPSGQMMNMTGASGPYPMERESSGTAWQPDGSRSMQGVMSVAGGWTLMAHGVLNLVYDHQSGPRGDDKAFASGMLMGMARRPLGNGTLQLKAMVSPDPLMGPSGYPLLLASGETANGRTPLIDRQHPHDLFMELSASASQNIGRNGSIFLYAGLPGEPAFGPPAFMHRESILDSPEAPITHHWLDSTHITFGVATAGLVLDRVKVEVSRFNAREPDQHRWDIETSPLDSTSVRVSWNPTHTLALQGSWGHFTDPEQLEPGVDQTRRSASALWARDIAPGWHAAATLAWGRKSSHGHNDDGAAVEASLSHKQWTVFGRGEMIDNRELILGQDEPAYRVGKLSVGAMRDFRVANHWSVGAGGLFSVDFVPAALAPLYGAHNPTGAMGFVRLKLD